MAGRVGLVTGAAQGIDLHIATELSRRGAVVILVDIAEDKVKQAAAQLPAGRSLALRADVTDAEGMRHVVQRVTDEFGRLDYVVANAGIAPPVATLRHGDDAAW